MLGEREYRQSSKSARGAAPPDGHLASGDRYRTGIVRLDSVASNGVAVRSPHSEDRSGSADGSTVWVGVDEAVVEIGAKQQWLYAAIDAETKPLLGGSVSEGGETDLAAALLGQIAEKHDFSETRFLVDGRGTTLPRSCDVIYAVIPAPPG